MIPQEETAFGWCCVAEEDVSMFMPGERRCFGLELSFLQSFTVEGMLLIWGRRQLVHDN
jgi:hypothetical protein